MLFSTALKVINVKKELPGLIRTALLILLYKIRVYMDYDTKLIKFYLLY